MKIQLKEIAIQWAESFLVSKEGLTFTTFIDAQEIITKLAIENKESLGYCKTGFTITWVDGRQHEGRIDVQYKNATDTNSIGKHVHDFYARCGCIKPVYGWTKEEQENYTRNILKADPTEYVELLELYSFDDAPEVIEEVEAVITPEQVETIQTENTGITYKLNEEKNGIEIYFTDKPSETVRDSLKSNGFRWSKYNKCWYAKQSDTNLSLAESFTSGNVSQNENIEIVLPEIELAEFVDVTQFRINEETEKRLIDNSLFGDRRIIGRETNELQATLLNLLEQTKTVIEVTDNNYYKNKLIEGFNGFCERYTRELSGYLYQKSINPSWAVTGRGNINVDRYNKKQDAIFNKMGKCVEMLDKQRDILKKYKNRFESEKVYKTKQSIQHAIDNLEGVTLSFATQKREIEYYGYRYNTRSYESPNYFMMKLAACYRIFDRTTGKEIHSMKTADKLTDAKKHVMYLEFSRNNEMVAI